MLHASHVSVRRGECVLLKDVSVSLVDAELTVILGASGSGKSTLLNVCAGLVTPDSGNVWLAGQQDSRWRPKAPGVRRALLTTHEPWQMAVCVLDVVAMGCHDKAASSTERRRRATLALERVGAERLRARAMPSLSTTEQVRVRLARLLVQMWDVLPDGLSYVLIDALDGACDQATQKLVFDIAKALAKRGAAVGLVSHDYTRVLDEADRVIILRQGEVVADGAADTLLTSARLQIMLDVDAAVEQSDGAARAIVVPRPSLEPWPMPFLEQLKIKPSLKAHQRWRDDHVVRRRRADCKAESIPSRKGWASKLMARPISDSTSKHNAALADAACAAHPTTAASPNAWALCLFIAYSAASSMRAAGARGRIRCANHNGLFLKR